MKAGEWVGRNQGAIYKFNLCLESMEGKDKDANICYGKT